MHASVVVADAAAAAVVFLLAALNFAGDIGGGVEPVSRVALPTMRKPFDVLAEGLLSTNSRGDRI